jgi:hypothetical protein
LFAKGGLSRIDVRQNTNDYTHPFCPFSPYNFNIQRVIAFIDFSSNG